MNNNSIVLRTVYALNPQTNQFLSPNQMLVTDGLGGTSWIDSLSTLIVSGGPVMNNLPSTIQIYSTQIYTLQGAYAGVSSMSTDMYTAISTLSTAIAQTLPGTITQSQLVSTTAASQNLLVSTTAGSAAVISTASGVGQVSQATVSTIAPLLSTYGIFNLSTATSYMQPSTLSSMAGLGSIGYVSVATMTNAFKGLGSIGYVSSTTMISSLTGLGRLGYVSSTGLASTVAGLSQLSYVSSSSLASTIQGLGSAGYLSTSPNVVGVSMAILNSSIVGLGNAGYVSTPSLVSTTTSLFNSRTNVRFDNTGQVTVVGGTNSFYNNGNIIYISSFITSSITYFGNTMTPMLGTLDNTLIHDMSFSTATISLRGFSNYINSNSVITIDLLPNIQFSKLASGASNFAVLPMNTYLQYGTSSLTNTTTTSFVNVTNSLMYLESLGSFIDSANYFTSPIKIQIPRGTIPGFASNYNVIHYMPSSINNGQFQNALHSNTVTPYFGSTGSLFVSVQNLPT